MLEVRKLHQYYGGSHILRGLSFEVKVGEVTCLLGLSHYFERLVGPSFNTFKQISLFAWIALKLQLGVVAIPVSIVYRFGLAALVLFVVLLHTSLDSAMNSEKARLAGANAVLTKFSSLATQLPPDTASKVASPLAVDWQDSAWMESRAEHHRHDKPLSIYELHVGEGPARFGMAHDGVHPAGLQQLIETGRKILLVGRERSP